MTRVFRPEMFEGEVFVARTLGRLGAQPRQMHSHVLIRMHERHRQVQ